MERLKAFIKSIIKYALAGGVISVITIIVCLIIGRDYSNILRYVAIAIIIIGILSMVGAFKTNLSWQQMKYTVGVATNEDSFGSTVGSAIYRVLKLFVTAAIIYGISLI